TVFRLRGPDAEPLNAGRKLGVQAVLTGRVRRQGEALDVQADLVRVADGAQLWGERFRRKAADLLAIQDEIAEEIAGALRVRLTGEEKQKLAKRPTENPEACELCLKGRFYLNKFTPESAPKAVQALEEAVALDPDSALAHAWLAEAYNDSAWFSLDGAVAGK